MKKLFIVTSLLLSVVSHADTITCTFTEPFVTTVYSTSQETLSIRTAGESDRLLENVELKIKSAGVMELVQDGKALQTLTLDHKGADGMSDKDYPYSVVDASLENEESANTGRGGCESDLLKAIERD